MSQTRIIFAFMLGMFSGSAWSATYSGQSALQFQGNQYISSTQTYFRPGADSDDTSVGASLDDELRYRSHFLGHMNVTDQWVASEHWNYLDVNELYGAFVDAKEQLIIGRKKENWTSWEQDWGQGLFQPRYMENRQRPQFAGLTGIFLSSGNRPLGVSWTVGVLPIFIPDFGPHFSVANDQFVSRNPWFSPPAAHFTYQGHDGDIHYALNQPPAEQVMRHAGLVAKTEYRTENYLMRVSAAYKPMPEVLLGFPSQVLVVGAGGDNVWIRVKPRVLYHRVFNLDQAYRYGRWTFSGSVAYEGPVDIDPPPDDWTSQQAVPAWIFSGFADRRLELPGIHAAHVRFGFFKVQGGDAPDSGELAGDTSLFERRYQYLEAYSLSFEKEFRHLFSHPLETQLRLVYDRIQNGGTMSFSSALDLDPNWRASLEFDLIGLMGGNAAVTDGFLSTYRANDRLGMGMSYDF